MFIHAGGKNDLTFILMRRHKYPAEVHAGNWIVNCNHDINLCEVYSDEEFHQYYEEVKESEDSHE